jgi:glucuronokinase
MIEQQGYKCGVYERLDPALLPPLYIAYSTEESEPTEATHGPLGDRYRRGDPAVHAAMQQFAELAMEARRALLAGEREKLKPLMDANFDLRRTIMDLAPGHIRMVETRAAPEPAKFAGSARNHRHLRG